MNALKDVSSPVAAIIYSAEPLWGAGADFSLHSIQPVTFSVVTFRSVAQWQRGGDLQRVSIWLHGVPARSHFCPLQRAVITLDVTADGARSCCIFHSASLGLQSRFDWIKLHLRQLSLSPIDAGLAYFLLGERWGTLGWFGAGALPFCPSFFVSCPALVWLLKAVPSLVTAE